MNKHMTSRIGNCKRVVQTGYGDSWETILVHDE